VIVALHIEDPVAGALVVSHRLDGSAIGSTRTDADGCAVVASEPRALVTLADPSSGMVQVLTTAAPNADRLVVRTDPVPAAPCHAGTLRVDASGEMALPPDAISEYYAVTLGCARFGCFPAAFPDGLPLDLDVPGWAVGSDGAVDVHVAHCFDTPGPNGVPRTTCGARVERVAPQGDVTVAVGDYTSSGLPGDQDPFPALRRAEADGLRWELGYVNDQPVSVAGLMFDHVDATAILLAPTADRQQVTVRRAPASAPRITFTGDDFLPELATGATVAGRDLSWTPPPFAADAVELYTQADLVGGLVVTWNFLLPPTLDHVTLPDHPDLPYTLSFISQLTAIDVDEHDGFAALLAGGVYLDDTDRPNGVSFPGATGARFTTRF
jgi:hypothetical protein